MKIHPVGAELFQADGRTDGQLDKHMLRNSGFKIKSFTVGPAQILFFLFL